MCRRAWLDQHAGRGEDAGRNRENDLRLASEGAALYGDGMRRMAYTFAQNEHAGSPPEAVAEGVERALTDRHPRTRYPAGNDSLKFTLLARFLPEKVVDLAILRTFGLLKPAH